MSQFGNLVFAENEISGYAVTACELRGKGPSWGSAPGVRVFGTGDAGPLYLETALDSSRLGTFVASALAASFSGCKLALGAPRACWNFQCIVWRSFDWKSWIDTEELTALMLYYVLDEILLDESEGPSIQSILVSDGAVLGAQDLMFVACLDPSESPVRCVPRAAGSGPAELHSYQDLMGYAWDVLIFVLFSQNTTKQSLSLESVCHS